MFRRLALLWMLGALVAPRCEALSSFTTPTPGLVENLSRQLHRSDWARITTDSTVFVAHVRDLGAQGLGGLSPVRPPATVPAFIPWSSVAQLDRRRSHHRSGQVVGLAGGTLLGIAVASGTGSVMGGEKNIGTLSRAGRTVGVVTLSVAAGNWIGTRIGKGWVRTRTLYVGSRAPDSVALVSESASAPPDAADSSAASVAASAAPTVGVPPDSARIARVLPHLQPNQRLRISGEFGRFEGFVGFAGPVKLEGLVPSRKADRNSLGPRELEWNRIVKIEVPGNRAGNSALVTGAAFAGAGLLIGMPIGGIADPHPLAFLAGGLIGAGIMGSFGFVLGGLVGSAAPAWHVIYPR